MRRLENAESIHRVKCWKLSPHGGHCAIHVGTPDRENQLAMRCFRDVIERQQTFHVHRVKIRHHQTVLPRDGLHHPLVNVILGCGRDAGLCVGSVDNQRDRMQIGESLDEFLHQARLLAMEPYSARVADPSVSRLNGDGGRAEDGVIDGVVAKGAFVQSADTTLLTPRESLCPSHQR